MKPTKSILIGLATTASIMGGVDASVLNEQPISRVEIVADERVEAKQIGNVIETTLPWKDQAGLKVKVDLGEPTLAERFADERKKEVITETVTDFEGGFKVDILLNEKPTTNVFCYDIEGDENYDFFYQPPLTAEEIANGDNRPPEIEGSYAVYHKTLANHVLGKENYATGKVMHIPRPQVWSLSDVETKVWADMTYSERDGLCVTVPQDFLDTATYPVRVDPTFGYTDIGGTSLTACGAESACGSTATTPSDAGGQTLLSISVYGSGTVNFKGQLYLKDGGGAGTHTTVSNSRGNIALLPSSDAWATSSGMSATLSASTNYLVGAVFEGGTTLYRDSVGSELWIEAGIDNYTMESSLIDVTPGTGKFSMYATYQTLTIPVVTTISSRAMSSTTATINGNITSDGFLSITQHGFAWGTNSTLSDGDTATTTLGATSTGAIYQTLTSLLPATTYYFRAYAVNSLGTSTGSILNFRTPIFPYVTSTMKGGVTVKGGGIIK